MPVCTFFGHRDCPESVKPELRRVLTDLIENHGVDRFYVGKQGQFDAMVRSTLRELKGEYAHIEYSVVLAYPPGRGTSGLDYSDTILPEGIESVHPRFAISWRNRWMIKRSDYVISYVIHSWGGAAQYAELAKKQNKKIICLKQTSVQ